MEDHKNPGNIRRNSSFIERYLIPALKTMSIGKIFVILLVLGSMTKCISANSLERRLIVPDPDVRLAALKELEAASPEVKAKIAKAMVKAVRHPPFRFDCIIDIDCNRRLWDWADAAINKTGKYGVPILAKALREEPVPFRPFIIGVLHQMGPDASEAVPDIIGAYWNAGSGHEAVNVREYVVRALVGIGATSPKAIFVLIDALNYEETLFDAYPHLVSSSPVVEAAFPVLVMELEKGSDKVFDTAYYFTPNSRKVVPQLIAALKNKNEMIRQWAAIALEGTGSGAVSEVSVLEKMLWSDRYSVRFSALKSLSKLGVRAAPALRTIVFVLGLEDEKLRKLAAQTVENMGEVAKPAGESLRGLLEYSDGDVRKTAAKVLVKLGVDPGDALPRSEVEAVRPKDRNGKPAPLAPITIGLTARREHCQPRKDFSPAALEAIPPVEGKDGIMVFGNIIPDFCSSFGAGCKLFSKSEFERMFYVSLYYDQPNTKYAMMACRLEKEPDSLSLSAESLGEWCARAEKDHGRTSNMELRVNFIEENGEMIGKGISTWEATPGGPLGTSSHVSKFKLLPLRRVADESVPGMVFLEIGRDYSGEPWFFLKKASGWTLQSARSFKLTRSCEGFWPGNN